MTASAAPQGRDLWADVAKLPRRYLITLNGAERLTLARSRSHDAPLDKAAALRGDLGPVIDFTEAAMRSSEIADIEEVPEDVFQSYIVGGNEDASDVADWSDDQIAEAAESLAKCETRTIDQSLELARLSGILADRKRRRA